MTDSLASFAYTDQRPAFVRNAKTHPDEDHHAAVFFREGRAGTNHGKIYMSYDNGVEMDPAFFEVKDSAQVVAKAGSGISAIRSPNQLGNDVAIVFKSYTNNDIRYLTGAIGTSGISWNTQIQTVAGAQTNKTPAALNFGSEVYFIWKDATSTAIKHKNFSSTPIAIPNANTNSAPTAVVAAGRLWVFFRQASSNIIMYTSKTISGHWTTPAAASEDAKTQWDPEAIYYQPLGGAFGDGRIWLYYKRPYDASEPDADEGTRMMSWKPNGSGGLTDGTPPVFLYQTRVPTGTSSFYSAFHWEASLRVYFPRLEAGDTIIWRMSKIGEG